MRAAVVAVVSLMAVLAGCGPAGAPVSAAHRVYVGTLPAPAPLPQMPAGVQLPGRGARGAEVYLQWNVVGVDPSGRVLRLVSHGAPDPDLPGCGSVPIAVRVEEDRGSVTVGLLGPRPVPAQTCAASLLVAVVDVHLRASAGARALYRWRG